MGNRFIVPFYVLSLLQGAFTIWMLVDAGRRQVKYFWYWLIIDFQPLGTWVYFSLYKFPELSAGHGRRWWGLLRISQRTAKISRWLLPYLPRLLRPERPP